MDFNYYYYRQQISLMRAKAAASPSIRAVHMGLAKGYSRMIEDARARRGCDSPQAIRP